MMNDFLLALSAIAPLFFPMAAGYLLKQIHLIDDHTVKGMNKVVFRFFLPLLLCCNVYHSDVTTVFNRQLIVFCIASVFISFFVFWGFLTLTEKDRKKRGVMLQGMFRSNFVLFGLPLAANLYGSEEIGIISILIAVIIPLYNVLAVISLEMCRGGNIKFKKIIKGIMTNPLILSSLLGLLILFSKVKVPNIIDSSLTSMSSVATPLALFLLGASFRFSEVKTSVKQLATVVTVKLLILPILGLSVGFWAGFRGISMAGLLAMFASPTAVSSFVMAQEMEGDTELASQIVVWTSALAPVTIFCFLLILKQIGGI